MIYHSVMPCYENPETIDLSTEGNRVRFTRIEGDLWHYSSMRLEDADWIHSTQPAQPLNLLWHHAMAFFGVIDPDDISHPPASNEKDS